MPAYLVYICQEVVDREELERYWSARRAHADHQGPPSGVNRPRSGSGNGLADGVPQELERPLGRRVETSDLARAHGERGDSICSHWRLTR